MWFYSGLFRTIRDRLAGRYAPAVGIAMGCIGARLPLRPQGFAIRAVEFLVVLAAALADHGFFSMLVWPRVYRQPACRAFKVVTTRNPTTNEEEESVVAFGSLHIHGFVYTIVNRWRRATSGIQRRLRIIWQSMAFPSTTPSRPLEIPAMW